MVFIDMTLKGTNFQYQDWCSLSGEWFVHELEEFCAIQNVNTALKP